MNVTAPSRRYLPALDREVDAGETIDLPEPLAASLVEQGWTATKPKPAPKASGKTTTTAPPAEAPAENEE